MDFHIISGIHLQQEILLKLEQWSRNSSIAQLKRKSILKQHKTIRFLYLTPDHSWLFPISKNE